jgi:dipeptidyl aminopeptidase/acylaminoacyl peptidase
MMRSESMQFKAIQRMVAGLLGVVLQIAFAGANERDTSDRPLSIEESLTALSLAFRTPIDLSPDGKWIAYTLQDPRKGRSVEEEERYRYFTETGAPTVQAGSDVWITNVTTRESRNLTQGKGNSWGPAWSPDGTNLAFYSDRSGQARLWIWDLAADRLSQVGDVIIRPRDGFDLIRWTRDGRKILTKILAEGQTLKSANEAVNASQSALDQEKRQPGSTVTIHRSAVASKTESVVGQDTTVSGDPRTKALRAELALIDVKTQKLERVAQGYNPLWYGVSPDGQSIAFTTNKGQLGKNIYRTLFDLVVIPKGGSARVVAANIMQSAIWFNVSWSPDGKWLSYSVNGEGACYLAPTMGGQVRKLTGLPPVAAFIRPPLWDMASENVLVQTSKGLWKVAVASGVAAEVVGIPDRRIRALVGRRDDSQICLALGGTSIIVSTLDEETEKSGFYRVDLKTGAYTRLIEEDKSYGFDLEFNLDVSDDGQTFVFTAEDGGHPRNFWTVNADFQQPRQISDINPQFNRYSMGKARIIEWRGLSGQKLRGVLVLPAGYVEGRRYPLLVRVYGGQMQSDVLNAFGFTTPVSTFENLQLFATRGYALLLPDAPLGAGTPMRDLADTILPGVNKAIELGVADADRLGVMGQSFGGYSTLSLLVQTPRFKAAIMRAGLGSLIGLYGEMRKDGSAYAIGVIEDGPIGMRGTTPWEFRERYIENSPIFYLDRVQTPLFIVHGTEDSTVAPFLADEVFVGLRRLGKEALYAKYQGEGHGLRMYTNQVDYWYRAIEWFDKHLKAPEKTVSRGQ